ncbi:hypothetical protein K525DRAFT_256747 [Schizophyllum commune Loenen D]|nr:hypothetical protein K525DRAFT_256747 [Schizophyllum commune Loenen D]
MKFFCLFLVYALPALGALLSHRDVSRNLALRKFAVSCSTFAAQSANHSINGTAKVESGSNGTQITLPGNDTAATNGTARGIMLIPSTRFLGASSRRNGHDILANGTIPVFLSGTTPANGTNGTFLLVPSTTFLDAAHVTDRTGVPANSTVPVYLNGTAHANGTEITFPGSGSTTYNGTVMFVPASSFFGTSHRTNGTKIPVNGTVPIFFNGTTPTNGTHATPKAAMTRAKFFQLY